MGSAQRPWEHEALGVAGCHLGRKEQQRQAGPGGWGLRGSGTLASLLTRALIPPWGPHSCDRI